ncbi:hypothetical protein ACRRTK_006149 [Alexandromys fortis]
MGPPLLVRRASVFKACDLTAVSSWRWCPLPAFQSSIWHAVREPRSMHAVPGVPSVPAKGSIKHTCMLEKPGGAKTHTKSTKKPQVATGLADSQAEGQRLRGSGKGQNMKGSSSLVMTALALLLVLSVLGNSSGAPQGFGGQSSAGVSPAEGHRFISDQGRRKELADRPPPERRNPDLQLLTLPEAAALLLASLQKPQEASSKPGVDVIFSHSVQVVRKYWRNWAILVIMEARSLEVHKLGVHACSVRFDELYDPDIGVVLQL